jgi:hypothetical protein
MWEFGIFFPFWYFVPRKIWQPWCPFSSLLYLLLFPIHNVAEIRDKNSFIKAEAEGIFSEEDFSYILFTFIKLPSDDANLTS